MSKEIETAEATPSADVTSVYGGKSAAALRTIDRAALDDALTFDEAIAETGLSEADLLYVSTPYEILDGKGKSVLINRPFLIRSVRFSQDKASLNEYVVLYIVTRDNALYIVTDGSTGIYQQIVHIVQDRLAKGHPRPLEGILVANGLRVSEYDLNSDNAPAQPGDVVTGRGATYYLA